MNKLKKFFTNIYPYYSKHVQKITFVIIVHFVSSYVINLPYINIFTSYFSFLPYFVDWVVILILFKPKKEIILKIGFLLFIVSFLFEVIRISFFLENLGQISFLMLGTYVMLVLKEIKK